MPDIWLYQGKRDLRDCGGGSKERLAGVKALSRYSQRSRLGAGPELWCLSCSPRFEQEVLGAPVTGIPTAVPTVPTVEAMQVPAAPVIRPIIATNTYQQVRLS